MHSTWKTTCSATTSATVRGSVMTAPVRRDGSSRAGRLQQPTTANARSTTGLRAPSPADRSPVVNPATITRLVGLGRSPVRALTAVTVADRSAGRRGRGRSARRGRRRGDRHAGGGGGVGGDDLRRRRDLADRAGGLHRSRRRGGDRRPGGRGVGRRRGGRGRGVGRRR